MEPVEIKPMPDTLRPSGISLTGEIPWGTNICHFYQSGHELTDIVLPFIKVGLQNNECCIWSLPQHIDGVEGIRLLKTQLPDFDRYIAAGALEILAYDNRSHRPEEAVSRLLEKIHAALRNGLSGVRLAWDKNMAGIKETLLEQRINRVISVQKVINLCNYCSAGMDFNQVLHIAAHYDHSLTSNAGHVDLFHVADAASVIEQNMADSWEDLLKRNGELEWFTYMVAHHLLNPLSDSIDVVRQFNNYAGNNPGVEPSMLSSVKKLEQMLEELQLVLRIANDMHRQKRSN